MITTRPSKSLTDLAARPDVPGTWQVPTVRGCGATPPEVLLRVVVSDGVAAATPTDLPTTAALFVRQSLAASTQRSRAARGGSTRGPAARQVAA